MATVYLLVTHWIESDNVVRGPESNVRNRAFVSADVRKIAARKMIDDLLARFNPRGLSSDQANSIHDIIDDMLYARKQDDFSYELGCCRDVFGIVLETQDISIELEELVGELVN